MSKRLVIILSAVAAVVIAVAIAVPLALHAQADAAQSARYKACMQLYERYNPHATVDDLVSEADKCEAIAKR